MRREGLLTGRMWYKSSRDMVQVRGKPTNSSKFSGRCGGVRCSKCHERPVSKAMAKTKGRNKRALWLDDEWALCARRMPAGRINSEMLLAAANGDYDDYDTYGAHDAYHNGADLMNHDALHVNDTSDVDYDSDNSDVYDNDDDDVDKTHDVNDVAMHAHDDVNDAEISMHAAIDHVLGVMPLPAVAQGDAGLAMVMLPLHALDGDDYIDIVAKKVIPVSDAIVDDNDDDGDAHAVDDGTLDNDDNYDDAANYGGHTMKVHAADDEDDHANDPLILRSLMAGLVNVEWCGLLTENNEEEVLDIESESDWCHVAPLDAIDDWYMC